MKPSILLLLAACAWGQTTVHITQQGSFSGNLPVSGLKCVKGTHLVHRASPPSEDGVAACAMDPTCLEENGAPSYYACAKDKPLSKPIPVVCWDEVTAPERSAGWTVCIRKDETTRTWGGIDEPAREVQTIKDSEKIFAKLKHIYDGDVDHGGFLQLNDHTDYSKWVFPNGGNPWPMVAKAFCKDKPATWVLTISDTGDYGCAEPKYGVPQLTMGSASRTSFEAMGEDALPACNGTLVGTNQTGPNSIICSSAPQCDRYQHVEHHRGACVIKSFHDNYIECDESVPNPPDTCEENTHVVTEREWQQVMERLKALEDKDARHGGSVFVPHCANGAVAKPNGTGYDCQ